MSAACYSEILLDLNNVYTCSTCYERPVFFTEEDYRAHDKRHHVMAIHQSECYKDLQQSTPRNLNDEKSAIKRNENELILDQIVTDMSLVKDAITIQGKQIGEVFDGIKDVLAGKYNTQGKKEAVTAVNSSTLVSSKTSQSSLVVGERRKTLERSLIKEQEEKKKLKSTVEELRDELLGVKSQNESLRDELSETKYCNNKLTEEIDLARTESTRNDGLKEKMSIELKKVKKELKIGQLDKKELKEELSSLKDEFDKTRAELEDSNRLKDHQLKCADDRYDNLLGMEREQRGRLEETIAEREKLVNSLIEEKCILKADYQRAKLDYEGLQKQNVNIKEDSDIMESKLAEKKNEIKKLQQDMLLRDRNAQEEAAQLKIAMEKYLNEIEVMKAETLLMNDLKTKLKDNEDEKVTLSKEIEKLKISLENITIEILARNGTISKLENDLNEISLENEKLSLSVDSKEDEVKTLKKELDETKENCSSLEDEAKSLKDEMLSLKKENNFLNKQMEKMNVDLEKFRKKKSDETKNYKKISKEAATVFSSSDDKDLHSTDSMRIVKVQSKPRPIKQEEQTLLNDDKTVTQNHMIEGKDSLSSKLNGSSAQFKSLPGRNELLQTKNSVIEQKVKHSKLTELDLISDEPSLEPKKANSAFDGFAKFPTESTTSMSRREIDIKRETDGPREVIKLKTRSKMADFDLFPSEPYANEAETDSVSNKDNIKKEKRIPKRVEDPKRENSLYLDGSVNSKKTTSVKKVTLGDSDSNLGSKKDLVVPKTQRRPQTVDFDQLPTESYTDIDSVSNSKAVRSHSNKETFSYLTDLSISENESTASEIRKDDTAVKLKDKILIGPKKIAKKGDNLEIKKNLSKTDQKPKKKSSIDFSDIDDILLSDSESKDQSKEKENTRKSRIMSKKDSLDDLLCFDLEVTGNREQTSKNDTDDDIDDLLASVTEPSGVKTKTGADKNNLFPTNRINKTKQKSAFMEDLFPAEPRTKTKQRSSFMQDLFPSTSIEDKNKGTMANDSFQKKNCTGRTRRTVPKISENNKQEVKKVKCSPVQKKNVSKTSTVKGQTTEIKDSSHTSSEDSCDFDDATIDAILQGL